MRCRFATTPAVFAIAATLFALPIGARAQSFNASGTIVAGAGAIATSAGSTTVSADAPNLVIDWSPQDTAIGSGAIEFQAAGTTALFTSRISNSLTVLNRIMPKDVTRPIVFKGKLTSHLVDPASGAIRQGVTLYFYTPEGLLLAPSGAINVGRLARTTSDTTFNAATGNSGTGGEIQTVPGDASNCMAIRGAAATSDAQTNGYGAAIVPGVFGPGTSAPDGSAVIVAADESTVTFRPDGLYDIRIDQISGAAEVPAKAVAGIVSPRQVFLVALPRNDAITLAIRGSSALGFDVAGAAKVDGNAVVLSSGPDLTTAVIDDMRMKASSAAPAVAFRPALRGDGDTAVHGSGPARSFLSDAPGTDDGGFISVGGIGSTLDVQGNQQIAGSAQMKDPVATAGMAGFSTASPAESDSDHRSDEDNRPCRP